MAMAWGEDAVAKTPPESSVGVLHLSVADTATGQNCANLSGRHKRPLSLPQKKVEAVIKNDNLWTLALSRQTMTRRDPL
jgi:hypothetical protein